MVLWQDKAHKKRTPFVIFLSYFTMKGAKLPTPARKIVPHGGWQLAASFYEIFPAPCLSAGAALEKSAFPTYRFFLIWLMALFLPSAHPADGARILFFPGGSKFRRGQGFAAQNACAPHLRRWKRAPFSPTDFS
ncbi:hypothetical protein [uncultured Flavonifractor sp.]|uniref:hypothetical protein n=1 Tax=uncultured Flavonifractor sp. TaxID=1193534 RepID=UPI002592A990|nr:hypothetical protein [uncultured Flavonifractor sp.]